MVTAYCFSFLAVQFGCFCDSLHQASMHDAYGGPLERLPWFPRAHAPRFPRRFVGFSQWVTGEG